MPFVNEKVPLSLLSSLLIHNVEPKGICRFVNGYLKPISDRFSTFVIGINEIYFFSAFGGWDESLPASKTIGFFDQQSSLPSEMLE